MTGFARMMLAGTCAMVLFATTVVAQDYPNKPIRVIVPSPPGSPDDFISRLMSERLQAKLKQTLIIENKPGAGGNIGAEIVA